MERTPALASTINRRQFLALSGAICAGPGLGLPYSDREWSAASREQLSYCWQQGAAFAVRNDALLPLYNFISLILLRPEYSGQSRFIGIGELRYITDATHRTTLDVVRNPFTGRRVQVAHEAHRPARYPANNVLDPKEITVNHSALKNLPYWLSEVVESDYQETRSPGELVENMSRLPTTLLAAARRIHPWIIRDPHAWLDATLRRPSHSAA